MTEHTLTAAGQVPEWTLQDRLRKAREWAQLEQTDLAALLGISRTSVGNYERAVSTPKRPTLLAWALATGVDLEWLTGGVVRHQGLEPRTRWLTVVGA